MHETYRHIFILLGILIWLFTCSCTELPDPNCTYRCSRKLYYCYYQVEKENRKRVIARVHGRLGCEKAEKTCLKTCQPDKE